jgi:hypothetical protein
MTIFKYTNLFLRFVEVSVVISLNVLLMRCWFKAISTVTTTISKGYKFVFVGILIINN